jgi:hypothetical protein
MAGIPTQSVIAGRHLWQSFRATMPMRFAVYNSIGVPVTDYDTGQVVQVTTATVLQVLLEGYESNEIDGVRIIDGDQRCMCWAQDLDTDPTLRDTVTIDGATWSVIRRETLVGGALLRLQLRQTGVV